VFFSPTRTGCQVVEQVARGISAERVETIDLTSPLSDTLGVVNVKSDVVILGAPVYGGRIPSLAVSRLRRLKAKKIPAVLVVVYGNRAYEDALLELKDLALQIGCVPVAGSAFIGEHSYSTSAYPIAAGRPDLDDLAIARDFGRQIGNLLRHINSVENLHPLHVPGNFPYRDYPGNIDHVCPTTDEATCQLCGGECASVCPSAAIVIHEKVITDPAACILCCACVKACPTGARKMDNPRINRSREWLLTKCAIYQRPGLFFVTP
jgi:ferredoxin